MTDASRAEHLRNADTDSTCQPADAYYLGATDKNELVVALGRDGCPQVGVFLDADGARNFLDRFTAEMQAMGFLS